MKFSKKLIEEYGIQTYRDEMANKNGLDWNAWCNATVARCCGEIGNSDKSEKAFAEVILERAKKSSPEEVHLDFNRSLAKIVGNETTPSKRLDKKRTNRRSKTT